MDHGRGLMGVNPNLIRVLYSGGLKNIVIINNDSEPLNKSPLPPEKLIELASRRDAAGVGVEISGNLAVLTISDVKGAKLSGMWDWVERLCGQKESLCILGEPRCPRDGSSDVDCVRTVAGVWECNHYVNGGKHDFKLNADNRVLHIILCLPDGTDLPEIDNGAVKLRRSGYQIIVGPHKSWVPYEPARLVNGEFKPISINELNACTRLSVEDVNQLLALLIGDGDAKPTQVKPKPVNEPQARPEAKPVDGNEAQVEVKPTITESQWVEGLLNLLGGGLGEFNYGKGRYIIQRGETEDGEEAWYLIPKGERKLGNPIEVFRGHIEFYVVDDPIFSSEVYVIKLPKKGFFGTRMSTVISDFLDDPITWNEPYIKPWVKYMFENLAPHVKGHVVGGFYPEGFAEGVLPYPVKKWGCNPKSLEDVINYIARVYPEGNRTYALANVALAIAKVFSPAVRLYRKVFEDRMVINVGQMKLGKTKLFYSIMNLLGLNPDDRDIYVGGDLPVKTPERVRNLLMQTNAPLFIDDINVEGFEAFAEIILPAMIGGHVIGLQANRVGYGFASEFRALRSVMVNTNVVMGEVRRILSRTNVAWSRRVIIFQWNDETPLPPGVDEWEGEPINECLKELWNTPEVRNVLLHARDIVDLARLTVDALRRRYGLNLDKLLEALKVTEELIREFETEVVSRYRFEELVIKRAYELTRQMLGITNVTAYQIIRAIVDNPALFDVKVTSSKDSFLIDEDLRLWEELVKELGYSTDPNDPKYNDLTGLEPGTEDFNKKLNDIEKALAYVRHLIAVEKKNRLIIYANSPEGLLQGRPRTLFGSTRGEYDGRKGYSVSWVPILRKLLNVGNEDSMKNHAGMKKP